jgi:hypothetical protein
MTKPEFNVCMTIPTGIGCEIGGHAGDAGPVARLLAATCDHLILHPNVVNASDINEMPPNALYVEGSTIDRWLNSEIELRPVRSNSIMVVVEDHEDQSITDLVIDSANAARATWGARISKVVCMASPPELKAFYDKDGIATAALENTGPLADLMNKERGNYDAVAIATIVDLPMDYHRKYFAGELPVNPWGGAEAVLTRWMSKEFNVPCAHAPMLEKWEAWEFHTDHVDPRMAAEAISCGFIHCVLKGLATAPRMTWSFTDEVIKRRDTVLVVPRNANGPAVKAANRHHLLNVIEVMGNRNLKKDDLTAYQWRQGKFHQVWNYFEAAGLILALREGIDPHACTRPLLPVTVEVA